MNFYVGLLNKGLAATPDKLGAGWCGEALGKGKAAIIFEGNWLLPYMKSTYPGIQYGVFPMVKGKTGGNLAFTVSYSMAKDAANKPAAWTLLQLADVEAGPEDLDVEGPRASFAEGRARRSAVVRTSSPLRRTRTAGASVIRTSPAPTRS